MLLPKDIALIAGLGNPGEEYQNTYHNVGFLALDALAQPSVQRDKGERRTKEEAAFSLVRGKRFARAKIGSYVLVKPLAFMNESGVAVAAALAYFKTKPEAMLVLHDDADIPAGVYKLAFGQGAAGHRGVASIIAAVGTKNFWRLRIGVRGPRAASAKRIAAGEFVLRRISSPDRARIQLVLDELTRNVIENVDP